MMAIQPFGLQKFQHKQIYIGIYSMNGLKTEIAYGFGKLCDNALWGAVSSKSANVLEKKANEEKKVYDANIKLRLFKQETKQVIQNHIEREIRHRKAMKRNQQFNKSALKRKQTLALKDDEDSLKIEVEERKILSTDLDQSSERVHRITNLKTPVGMHGWPMHDSIMSQFQLNTVVRQ